jgi:protein SDA1
MHGEDEPPSDGEEDDENAWEGWELESESSDHSSDSGGWIDVESDGDHLNISDSEDEDKKNIGKPAANEAPPTETNRTSTLATTKVCPILPLFSYSMHIVTRRFLPRPILH